MDNSPRIVIKTNSNKLDVFCKKMDDLNDALVSERLKCEWCLKTEFHNINDIKICDKCGKRICSGCTLPAESSGRRSIVCPDCYTIEK